MSEQNETQVETPAETPVEEYAYLAKSGMIHTEPKCMNFVQLDKADTPTKRAKTGAIQISLTDAFKRVQGGAQHCGMCIKIQKQEAEKKAAETVNIPGLGELPKAGVEALAANGPKAPARKTAPKKSQFAKGTVGHAIEQQEKAAAKAEPKTEAPAKPKTRKIEGKANGTNAISLFEVFAKADEDGKLPTGALTAYRLKVKAVLIATGGDLEKTDLTKLDVEATLAKFEENSKTLLVSTRRSYKDAFKRAVRLFCAYVEDAENWNPTAPAERAPRVSGGPNPTKSQVRAWALEQGHVTKDELGPNYVPVALINKYKEAHASA